MVSTRHASVQLARCWWKTAEKLASSIFIVWNNYFPLFLRYRDRTRSTDKRACRRTGTPVRGTIRMASVVPGRRRSLLVKVVDGSSLLTLRFSTSDTPKSCSSAKATASRSLDKSDDETASRWCTQSIDWVKAHAVETYLNLFAQRLKASGKAHGETFRTKRC